MEGKYHRLEGNKRKRSSSRESYHERRRRRSSSSPEIHRDSRVHCESINARISQGECSKYGKRRYAKGSRGENSKYDGDDHRKYAKGKHVKVSRRELSRYNKNDHTKYDKDHHTKRYEDAANHASTSHMMSKHKSYTQDNSSSDEEQKRSPSVKQTKSNDAFSFLDYKYEISRVLQRCDLGDNQDDFWKFLKKYEFVKRKAKSDLRPPSLFHHSMQRNELGVPNGPFDKLHFLNLDIAVSQEEIIACLPPRDLEDDDGLTDERLAGLRQILRLYLDFRLRENFTKLCKLRDSQRNLPVTKFRDEITKAVQTEKVVIIAGDTGCGKSTQIPQYLMKAGYKKIACTQPRRIACISLSKRVAFETLSEYGTQVGYQIRFERNKDLRTRILFITEGLLLRQVASEDALSSYDVLVLDEVHERHLHGDFLLGVVKCLLHQRPDLKVILMSATINISLFSDYFGDDARIIQVPGRLFPIKLQYFPISQEDKMGKSERFNAAPYVRILQLIDSYYPKKERGDVLMFLSGMTEIQGVVTAAREYNLQSQSWIILALHSTLSLAEQDKVFDYAPDGVRKCIVSTNIAETSVTIDGIRFVVDSGKVKEMSYDPVHKMQRLKEFWISKASAEQRKGRAGRTGPGVCYRLYSEEDYQAMEQYSTPELQRVPLDSLLLQMVSMGLPDARKFPFIESPPIESIEHSIRTLQQQGALTYEEKLTPMGRMLSKLPVDIPLGKMLIMGSLFHQVQPVLSLAASLSVQTPFTNRAYRDPECENARKSLESDHGDPFTLLNAFREWLEEKNRDRGRDRSSTRKWCYRRGLEEQRFYEITKLRKQFEELLSDCNMLKQDKISSENMSSNERMLRHGELRLLKNLRKEHQRAAPRKRSYLKYDPHEIRGEEEGCEEGSHQVDIKDVEFRIRNDASQVKNLLSASSACSYKDLMMLKVILLSGLYPQIAVADDFNYCKSANEQLFHTKTKPFIALHPMSYFGNHPQALQLSESDIVVPDNFNTKLPVSSRHQILCYTSLLETTKPYLVNTFRLPAAQSLLLFSQEIHTNFNFSKIVCDSWLQLEFPLVEAAEVLVMKVSRIHRLWDELLQLRLEDKESDGVEKELSDLIIRFMKTEVVYTVKRLMPADIKVLFVGPSFDEGCESPEINPFHPGSQIKRNERKGGLQMTRRITYNSLVASSAEIEAEEMVLSQPWHCDLCEITVCLPVLERLQHQMKCKDGHEEANTCTEEASSSSTVVTASSNPNAKSYECSECKKTLMLTPMEILRHKKQHQSNAIS